MTKHCHNFCKRVYPGKNVYNLRVPNTTPLKAHSVVALAKVEKSDLILWLKLKVTINSLFT